MDFQEGEGRDRWIEEIEIDRKIYRWILAVLAECICEHTCRTFAGATVHTDVVLPSTNPQWHVWSSELISCMHQYSSWSHMYLPHLVPFSVDSLSTLRLNINHPFSCGHVRSTC